MDPVSDSPASPDPHQESPGSPLYSYAAEIVVSSATESGSSSTTSHPTPQEAPPEVLPVRPLTCAHCKRTFSSRFALGQHVIEEVDPLEMLPKRKPPEQALYERDEKPHPWFYGLADLDSPNWWRRPITRRGRSLEQRGASSTSVSPTSTSSLRRGELATQTKSPWLVAKEPPSAAAGSPADLKPPPHSGAASGGSGPQRHSLVSAVRVRPYIAPAGGLATGGSGPQRHSLVSPVRVRPYIAPAGGMATGGSGPHRHKLVPTVRVRPYCAPAGAGRGMTPAAVQPSVLVGAGRGSTPAARQPRPPVIIFLPNILRRTPRPNQPNSGGICADTGSKSLPESSKMP
ncbi:uncharacterized protein LOC144165204 [Haemaphysalis longicornis]